MEKNAFLSASLSKSSELWRLRFKRRLSESGQHRAVVLPQSECRNSCCEWCLSWKARNQTTRFLNRNLQTWEMVSCSTEVEWLKALTLHRLQNPRSVATVLGHSALSSRGPFALEFRNITSRITHGHHGQTFDGQSTCTLTCSSEPQILATLAVQCPTKTTAAPITHIS